MPEDIALPGTDYDHQPEGFETASPGTDAVTPRTGDDFVAAIQEEIEDPGTSFVLRAGAITAYSGGKVSITVGGEPTVIDGISFLDSVSPYVGAKVWIAQFGDQYLVIGTQSANGSGRAPGEIFYHWGDSEVLPGALLCYGQTIASADTLYPGLWAWAPAAAKSGTSLTLPDGRGRGPVGRDNMGGSDAGRLSSANTIGTTGGTETHTLSTSNMPSHDHSLSGHTHSFSGSLSGTSLSASTSYTGGHTHSLSAGNAGAQGGWPTSGGGGFPVSYSDGNNISANYNGDHSHSVSGSVSGGSVSGTTGGGSGNTGSNGSGAAVNHMNPFITLNMFIVV